MGKLTQLLAVLAVAAVPVFAVPTAGAVEQVEQDCTISNTGPGSDNECVVENTYTCELTNDNKIVIKNENDQIVASGDATVDGNTQGGGSYSGNVSNGNDASFDVVIENGECISVTKVTPEQPETPVTPTPEAPVQPTVTEKPTVLAETAGDQTGLIALSVVAAASVLSAATYGAVALRKRLN